MFSLYVNDLSFMIVVLLHLNMSNFVQAALVKAEQLREQQASGTKMEHVTIISVLL